MPDTPDARLLEQFVRNSSEEAFTALVQRHIGLVHSVALRHTAHSQHAEDITQAVFIILARKADRLGSGTVLPGWLYHTARLTAANWQRAEARRVRREQEAFMQSQLEETPTDNLWHELSPQLDQAMAGLGTVERDALVLRYFQNKGLAEVGQSLGLSENAAQKRVHQALEKLRRFFSKRGVDVTASHIADTISTHSVQAVPAALVKSVAAVALAKGTAATTTTLTLVKGALNIMAWTKAKTVTVAAIIALLVAGGTTLTIGRLLIQPKSYFKISGKGQIEIHNLYNNQSRIVETADITVLTDGEKYRISIVSRGNGSLTNDAEDMRADYASDGVDTFVLSDQSSYFHRTREGFGGFALSGRFPNSREQSQFIPTVVQAVWLAYCSGNYFNQPDNQTGLKFGDAFSIIWPDFVTNRAAYSPNSTLPQNITGWSRNLALAPRTNSAQIKQALRLDQYPDGFKAWQFSTADPATIGNRQLPRQITFETFWPKWGETVTNGNDVDLLRKTTFVADSIETIPGRLDPLPPVPVPDLQIEDARFKPIVGNFLISSHATTNGWPVRGSKQFKQALAQANQLAKKNQRYIQSDLKQEALVVMPP